MSQIKGINKSETKVVYTLSKDNDFFKQMTEVLIKLGLHEGFIDKELKLACYTDHQIFERHHKFKSVSKQG